VVPVVNRWTFTSEGRAERVRQESKQRRENFVCRNFLTKKDGRKQWVAIFLDHIGGSRLFSCASGDTILTKRSEKTLTLLTWRIR